MSYLKTNIKTALAKHRMNSENEKCSKTSKTIFDLPDHFIISTISRLDLKQRIQCSRVCKKWNRLAKDPSMWSIIDLRDYKRELSLDDVKKIILHFGSASTKELLICGNFTFDYVPAMLDALRFPNAVKKKTVIKELDADFVKNSLLIQCPNLNLISLEYLDLTEIEFGKISQLEYLKTFSLRWCDIPSNWFETQHLSEIRNLYLIRTGLLNIKDIEDICLNMPQLITLSINQAVSTLGDDSIEIICKNLINLKELDLVNTVLSDNAVGTICNSTHLCSNLNRLNLTMSSKISNDCLNLMADNLRGLNTLYLTSCFGISNINFLLNLKNLNYLNINNTSIDKHKIKENLLPHLPKCEIEYGHEKMLNRKLMWTINSSRNSVCSF